jgi:hypothetical protein
LNSNDGEDLSVREVNDVLLAIGLDPVAVREFAWQLVRQELVSDLEDSFSLRVIAIGDRLKKLIYGLEGNGVTKELMCYILYAMWEDLTSQYHKDKQVLPQC